MSEPPRARESVRKEAGILWLVAGSVATLAAALWLRWPSVPYLAAVAIATAATAALGGRRWRMGWRAPLLLALAAFVGMSVFAQVALRRIDKEWEGFDQERREGGAVALERALAQAVRDARATARSAVEGPAGEVGSFERLAAALEESAPGERGVVRFEDNVAVAWSGRQRVAAESLRAPIGVVQTPFYVVLYASAEEGNRRAVATVLVSAAPPADRLARALDAGVAEAEGLRGFEYRLGRAINIGWRAFPADGPTLVALRAIPLTQGEARLDLLERARARGAVAVAVALVLLLGAAWRRPAPLAQRIGALGIGLLAIALVPLNAFSNLSALVDPTYYYASFGGPWTASVGALGLTSALILVGLLAYLRGARQRATRLVAVIAVIVVAGLGPFLLRDLARGIAIPRWGVTLQLWLSWEVALFLAAAAVLVAGATAGRSALGNSRGLPPSLAPLLAGVAALLAPVLWDAPGNWPGWYPAVWIAAMGALALARRSRALVFNAAIVAACGATTLVWGATSRGRVQLAERDVEGLRTADPGAIALLERFMTALQNEAAPTDRSELLQSYVRSDLASAGFPVELATWGAGDRPDAELVIAEFARRPEGERAIVEEARAVGRSVIREALSALGVQAILAVPYEDGRVTSVVVAPRTNLIPEDPFTALIGLAPVRAAEPPYTLTLASGVGRTVSLDGERWVRSGDELHADWDTDSSGSGSRIHVEVELRTLPVLVERGALVVLLDLVLTALLWTLVALADGGLWRWTATRLRRWAQSYRARLTLALFAFFVIPAALFALWSYNQLQDDDRQSRELLVRETLRAVATPGDVETTVAAGLRLGTPLFIYRGGVLTRTSDPLYDALAPTGRFLPLPVMTSVALGNEIQTSRRERIGGVQTLFGYRAFDDAQGQRFVLAAPARSDELALDRERRDLGILLLFALSAGALAALWLSGLAAREFERPIMSLRRAALAVAAGDREPALVAAPPSEFQPVFSAFRKMAADLATSRHQLQEAQRRTEAVLRDVASGVIATDLQGRVTMSNPRAAEMLGASMMPDASLSEIGATVLADRLRVFLEGDEEVAGFELTLNDRQLRASLTRLQLGAGGAVLTLDDVTELARAQRVLAWGEMARQIAHEIKNPLTPIRLGVQHLRRAHADNRVDFERVLGQNVTRILSEIDRLDEIARAFSRYGLAPAERSRGEMMDVAAVARDVVELERMGEGGSDGAGEDAIDWHLSGADDPVFAIARRDELREVVLNVLENARLANAHRIEVRLERVSARVTIVVRDDGQGIAADVLPRIFEPHFSTRTSGSGFGLAFSRSIVDAWGGEITVSSQRGEGTEVRIALETVVTP